MDRVEKEQGESQRRTTVGQKSATTANNSRKRKNRVPKPSSSSPTVTGPGRFDVVFGRGHRCNEHRKFYNELMEENWKGYYDALTPSDKAAYVKSRIVDKVHDAGGRFLKWMGEKGTWIVVKDEQMIVRKLAQKIRDLQKSTKQDEDFSSSSWSTDDSDNDVGPQDPNDCPTASKTEVTKVASSTKKVHIANDELKKVEFLKRLERAEQQLRALESTNTRLSQHVRILEAALECSPEPEQSLCSSSGTNN